MLLAVGGRDSSAHGDGWQTFSLFEGRRRSRTRIAPPQLPGRVSDCLERLQIEGVEQIYKIKGHLSITGCQNPPRETPFSPRISRLFARGLQSVRISEDFYTKIRIGRSVGADQRMGFGIGEYT